MDRSIKLASDPGVRLSRWARPGHWWWPGIFAGLVFAFCLVAAPAFADSSSPLLAAYYDRQMAIIDGSAYVWQGSSRPKQVATDAVQVGVGRTNYYVLTGADDLLGYRDGFSQPQTMMTGVARFAAGRTGVLAVKPDGTLWWIDKLSRKAVKTANNVVEAAVGDGANYYITKSGDLFVKGKAHRGQYGDGRLATSEKFVTTASQVSQITAHTGHAILLKMNGDVLGTGGNIYGPVGKHGLGDKAIRWSKIMSGATAIATGSSHTLAIKKNGTLFAWGSEYGTEPVAVLGNVLAAAAGSSTTIALTKDGKLWQWKRGGKPWAHSLD
ncbi:MAG: hypothetical protein GY948_10545 [Alphaproteobacteria bacterium]|nr:hypothetical protein [Alphaproteobacteria bacterium]